MSVGLDARLLASERQPTGVGTYARELARHLAPLTDLHLFTDRAGLDGSQPDASGERRPAVHTLARWPGLPWQQTALPMGLLAHRVKVYHSPTFTLPRWAPCATVVTVHDLGAVRVPEWANPDNRRYLDRMLPWAVHHADRVITVSQRVRDEVLAYFHLSGAAARRVVAVDLGVDHGRFRQRPLPEVDGVLRRLGVRGPYLLFVGTREPRKNLVRLVTAFNIARRRHEDWTLVLAGPKGFNTAALDQVVARTPMVKLLDYVGADDVAPLVQGAAALCYVSLYEGFGLPVLEAMAVGTPVITSRDTVMEDVSAGRARYVDPHDSDDIAAALSALMDDPAAFRRDAAAHIGYAQAITWGRTARETLRVYQEVAR